jgi:5-formyltetrahydrofolate cyclo-ligase
MSTAVAGQLAARLADYRLHPSSIILAYWPLPDEVDVRPLIDQLVAEGHTVLLPKVTGDETMELRRYTSQADLSEGAFHIMEPVGEPFVDYEQIDVALVPGVAFDAAGHRLGRGRGYYDRFLAEHLAPRTSHLAPRTSPPVPRLIGVCFPFQRVAVVPVEAHDVVLDQIIC